MTDTRLVRASGTAGERGESIGAATGKRIHALLAAQDQEHRDRDGLTNAAPAWTLASMVFEPAAGTMHLAFGNGCEEPYTAYRFDP